MDYSNIKMEIINAEDKDEMMVDQSTTGGNLGSEYSECEESGDDFNEDAPLVFNVGRNGKTRWYSVRPPSKKNKIQVSHYPSVRNIAKDFHTPLDCWKLLFDNSILEEIVRCTNKFILQNRDESKKDTDEKYTDISELKALCGLLYMCGMYGNNYLSPSDLWRTDGTGVEIFSLTMSYERFEFLIKSLNFDDIKTRTERKEQDKIAQVRNLIESFIKNCQKSFSLSDLICIQDKYECFRGKCSFKQYDPHSNNKKYGIKIYAALDAIMFYTFNFEIDIPNQVNGKYKYDNSPENIVLRLCKPILNEGHTIICDQPYCTPLLSKKLLSKNTYLVGKWNRHELVIPKQFASNKTWDHNKKYEIAYTEDITLVATLKKKTSTIIISTRPNENAEELPTFVNTVHDMVQRVKDTEDSIQVNRTNTRWPMLIFYYLLNTSVTNCLILSRCNGAQVQSRQEYVRDLSMSLINDHLIARCSCDSVPLSIKARISKITNNQITNLGMENLGIVTRHRCQECPTKRNRKTTNVCVKCKRFLCIQHLVKICSSCYDY